jgi:hypothetical protein
MTGDDGVQMRDAQVVHREDVTAQRRRLEVRHGHRRREAWRCTGDTWEIHWESDACTEYSDAERPGRYMGDTWGVRCMH